MLARLLAMSNDPIRLWFRLLTLAVMQRALRLCCFRHARAAGAALTQEPAVHAQRRPMSQRQRAQGQLQADDQSPECLHACRITVGLAGTAGPP